MNRNVLINLGSIIKMKKNNLKNNIPSNQPSISNYLAARTIISTQASTSTKQINK